jgi:peptidoglycan/xylan/chitin deacetylase (PgdA/CDA1 family)
MRTPIQSTRLLRAACCFLGCTLLVAGAFTACATSCGCVDTGKGGLGAGGTLGGAGGGGVGGTVHAASDLPPAPPTSNVAQPTGSVASPNLRVLPWAGFKAALSYTFDDSQPSQMEHWPELKATGVPMTFFLNPSANWQPGYDADWTAVRAAGSELGNHTWSHCHADLSGCTPVGTQADEIDQATTYITSHLGAKSVYAFAAPFGDSGWSNHAAPKFLLGRGVVSGLVPAAGVSDWYNLPVFPVVAGQTATDFNAGIDRARAQGRWSIFMYHSIMPTTNNWFAGVEIADITASLAYAKSLGDVWVDSITAIGAYARAQQAFEAVTPSANTWTWTLPEHFPPGKVLRVTVDGGSLRQGGTPLVWDAHGYYQVALDAQSLTWKP